MFRAFSSALAVWAGVSLCLSSGIAAAHHSFSAEFDADKPIKLTGTVTGMRWANPHAWIYIDVEDEDGNVVNWSLETQAANGLIRRGWRRDDLPVGTVLQVEGWQARNGSPTANISSVTFTDGRRLFSGSSNPAARQE
jgi:Family of unknown function (DUF6152)